MVYKWSSVVLEQLFPRRCLLCGTPAPHRPAELCIGCERDLARNRHACPRCAAPLPPGAAAAPCGACQRRPPPFAGASVPFLYQPPLDTLLHQLKYRGRLDRAKLLGELAAAALEPAAPDQLLVPVPLHPGRLRERGFNQALELARPVARRWRLELAPNACRRTRATDGQPGLDSAQRRRNVLGAFAGHPMVRGRRVILLDDILTSGATVGSAARALLQAGAEEVTVWCIARVAAPGGH